MSIKASTSYNLEIINPTLAKEWHPTKNEKLTPFDVTPGSRKKVWWICAKGHEWEARVSNRHYLKRGCPYCSGQRANKSNCLQTINLNLAKEWHPTKNGKLTPFDVTPGSGKKVWWICAKGHKWTATVNSRNQGKGCPYCSGRRRLSK